MDKRSLDKLLRELTPEQRKYLLNKLRTLLFKNISREVTECPCCKSNLFVKQGSYKDIQKYKCKTTNKTFTYKSKTILSGIKKLEKFEEMLDLMINGKKFPTIRELNRDLSISQQAVFEWRTKVITALYNIVNLDNNVIEFDEKPFRLSWKGRRGIDSKFKRKRGKKLPGDNNYNVKVFLAFSRTTKKLELFVSHMGRTSAQDVENYLGTKKDIVVYSDMHPSYQSYYNKREVLHGTFKSSDHVSKTNKEVHNQSINYYCRMLEEFLTEDLRGVSTKYLQGYLNWFMFIINTVEEHDNLIESVVLENKVALDIYKQKEKELQYFLKHNGRSCFGLYSEKYVLSA